MFENLAQFKQPGHNHESRAEGHFSNDTPGLPLLSWVSYRPTQSYTSRNYLEANPHIKRTHIALHIPPLSQMSAQIMIKSWTFKKQKVMIRFNNQQTILILTKVCQKQANFFAKA